jgi:hypothetical protein
VNPRVKGRLDAIAADNTPLSEREALPWDCPIKRLSYYLSKKQTEETERRQIQAKLIRDRAEYIVNKRYGYMDISYRVVKDREM